MKKKYCYYVAFVLPVFVFWLAGCTDEFLPSPAVQTELKEFALEEAQEYFRSEAEKEGVRSRGESEVKALSPGDFVPDWDGAVGSSSGGLACYDVPIEADYRYKAVYAEERHGTVSAERVNVYQKLVIVKDVKSERMSQYILTLIPSKAYDARYGSSVCDRFITRSDKGGFSGVAVYSCVYSAYTARVDTYKDGVKQEGVFLLNGTERGVSDAKADYARSLMSPLQVKRTKILMSRGEDDYFYEMPYEEVPSDDGWLSGVECVGEAPVTDWDGTGADGMTNDEWMSSTTPDSTVDPSPEDGTSNETDDVTTSDNGGNQEQSGEPDVQFSGFNASELQKVKSAITSLQQRFPNLNLNGLRIQKGKWNGNGGISKDGTILLKNGYFNLPLALDRTCVLWHEIYHLQNGHNAGGESHSIPRYDPKVVPEEIELRIKNEVKDDFNITDDNSKELELYYRDRIAVISVISSEYYENELETYEKEKELFPDGSISEDYKNNRDYNVWMYEQKLIAARNNNY